MLLMLIKINIMFIIDAQMFLESNLDQNMDERMKIGLGC